MHQIRFLLGLRPRPHWGSSQRSPRPSSWILGGPTSKGRKKRAKGNKGKEREGVKGGGKGGRTKREKEKKEKRPSQLKFLVTPL